MSDRDEMSCTRSWSKVFEVGSPKTGTSSLGRAFEVLNLRHKGWDPKLYEEYKRGDLQGIVETARLYDAFEDGPWHAQGMYTVFDREFPNSKFILLERDTTDWIRSHENHFSARENRANINEKYLIDRYEDRRSDIIRRHIVRYEEIKEYFRGRPNDLLVMSICDGEGWERLCPFLGLPLPGVPFPHANKTPE